MAAAPHAEAGPIVFLRDRKTVEGRPTAYVCEGQTCGLPLTDPTELSEQLSR
ncbi:hypothetical protein D3C86_2224960 [compost metagenome]